MARRNWSALGLVFGAAAWTAWLAALPPGSADEAPKDVRLLVATDQATKPKVLDALRSLGVGVLDLGTLQWIPLETTATPGPHRGPLPGDVRGVLDAVQRAVEAASKEAKDPTLRVIGTDISERTANLTVAAAEPASYDALRRLLRESSVLTVQDVSVGRLARQNGLYAANVELRARSAGNDDWPVSDAGLRLQDVASALQASGAAMQSSGAERSESYPDSLLVWREFDVRVGASAARGVLDALAALPGLRVIAALWQVSPKDEPVTLRVKVAARSRRS